MKPAVRGRNYRRQNGRRQVHRNLYKMPAKTIEKLGLEQATTEFTSPQRRRIVHKRNHNSQKATRTRNRMRVFRLRRNEERAKRRMFLSG